ncbi:MULTISPECIES: ferredoxin family protein [Rhizobium]|uniref:Ferredoxin-like protein n=2 Tax=Rhizobium TaxID=379 RepID=A0A387FY85_9HYPH|nr:MULTISPECIES: ferredoxin family protein [Rhizobium]AYG64050.1 ferredoxin family protein [Rhizobium jaguaris]MDL2402430.1 ferredoxin family protein [Rhizobium mayense]
MTVAATKLRVEDKLFQNRYLVDPGRPHITVRPHEHPSANLRALTRICPAKCYELNDKGQVEIAADGCMECGTCRVLCEASGEVVWNYPRGGFGVLFKFG